MLYIWDNVLTSWADGLMIAQADDIDEARELILKNNESLSVVEDLKNDPKVYSANEKVCRIIHGGD